MYLGGNLLLNMIGRLCGFEIGSREMVWVYRTPDSSRVSLAVELSMNRLLRYTDESHSYKSPRGVTILALNSDGVTIESVVSLASQNQNGIATGLVLNP